MKLTFFSHSFGCRVNQAEKEELDRELIKLGHKFTETDPDIFIINSCSVTRKAEREARQLIYQKKRKNPEVKIIVTGCAATNWLKLKTNIPEIDLLVDNQNKEYLAHLINKKYSIRQFADPVRNSPRSRKIPLEQGLQFLPPTKLSVNNLTKYANSSRMILKIQDGCQRFCSYCIVPYLRGLPKSRSIKDIVSKIKLIEKDISEITLTSINTEAFGQDTKESFINLVDGVLNKTKIRRLGFGSIHPWSVNEDFFKFYTNHPERNRIIKYFHIPLQSGSNKILNLMKRGYTKEEFEDKLKVLASIEPYSFIATDVIVGFLEESDNDFEQTYEFLNNSPISKFHIFRYSPREHTAAFYMGKQLKEPSDSVKRKRAKILAELNNKKYSTFIQKHLDITFPALILEKEFNNFQEALLNNQIPILIEINNKLIGTIKNVKIIQYKSGRLFGKIVT